MSSWIRQQCIFIWAAFKSHTKWSIAPCISAAPTTIQLTIVGTNHGLNCFSYVIYTLQTTLHAKLGTWILSILDPKLSPSPTLHFFSGVRTESIYHLELLPLKACLHFWSVYSFHCDWFLTVQTMHTHRHIP